MTRAAGRLCLADMTRFTIVFDLDGTLVDTAPDLIAVTNDMLVTMDCGPVPEDAGRIAAGQGARALLCTGLEAHGRPLPPEDAWPELIAEFIRLYAERIAERSRPFAGMRDVVRYLRSAGFGLAVCTNKKDFLAESLLRELGMAEDFHAIVGANTLGVGKPDPAPLLHGIAQAGGEPERALLLGDSMADVLAARAAGAFSALAGWGYLDRPASAYQADFTVETIPETLALIEELAATSP